ncbi:MAG: Wzz/FepE/Etk N-terminal domain-containing protein, partial [Ghiorsea sp.]|nr:Wzz/FepE/Etk N-terminal domain-containing protein [Ghiorsea sp.]
MVDVKQNEVSLADLWQVLVQQKKVVAYVWVACLLLALVYVIFAAPTYKAEVVVSPPSLADVEELNQYFNYTPVQIFVATGNILKSKKIRRYFFDEMNLKQTWLEDSRGLSSDQLFVFFDKALTVSENLKGLDKKRGEVANFSVSLEGHSSSFVVKILNQFVEFSLQSVTNRLIEDSVSKIKSEQFKKTNALSLVLKYAKLSRADHVT